MALFSSTIAQLEESPHWALLPGKIKVRQHYRYDCGAACLASVAAYWGIHRSLANLRMLCGCTPEGISIQGIIDGAAKIGLHAKGLLNKDKDTAPLKDLPLPAIAHIKDDGDFLHYIVIYGSGAKTIKIMDPATGKLEKVSLAEFKSKWTGYIITLSPDTALAHRSEGSNKWAAIKPLVMGNIRELLLTLAATAFCTAASVCTTLLLQQIVDNIVPKGDMPMLAAVSTLAVILMFASLYAGYRAAGYLIRCSIGTECSLVASYTRKLFRLPLEFFDNCSAGDISSRTDDIYLIRSFVTGGIISIATSLITVLGAVAIMFVYNRHLAVFAALFIPLYWIIYKMSGRINTKYGKMVATAGARFESTLIGSIPFASTLRHYNCGHIAAEAIGARQTELAATLQQSSQAVNLLETLLEGVSKMLICIVLSAGTWAVLKGEMTLGELVGFYSLCSFFTVPVNELVGASNTIAKARVAYDRIFEILSLEEADTAEATLSPEELDGDIEICNLHFRYPGREPLFNGLDATIKAGKTTRIEGVNGCGKSTLLQLIMGDFAPTGGTISFAGINIRQFNGSKWRNMVSYVEQHPQLLDGNILENITLWEDTPDINRVMQVCSSVGMEGMLERLPQGLLTKVGSGGKRLSGGESQKICLARALYKKARIYIFDEATASLNAEGEEVVAQCMNSLRDGGKTVIYISHRQESRILTDNVVSIN